MDEQMTLKGYLLVGAMMAFLVSQMVIFDLVTDNYPLNLVICGVFISVDFGMLYFLRKSRKRREASGD